MSTRIVSRVVLSLAFAVSASWGAAQSDKSDGRLPAGTVPDLGTRANFFGILELQRIIRGFQISPVPLNLQGKDLALVGLGSYIVNAQGGCNDCHTNPPFEEGGNPFLGQPRRVNVDGYLAGGMEFGPFVSRNITPDGDGKPAGLTFAQFRTVLRTGKDLENLPPHVPSEANDLLQVMPWPVYGQMLDHDMRAIYEFLRAIPPIEEAKAAR
ncbi:MAG TPA: cytochrome C [Vicinamibacteria bacterium]|nr:cytochrome C [Vicinamibacteria bacterium]